MALADDLVGRERIMPARRRRPLRGGKVPTEHAQAQRQRRNAQGHAHEMLHRSLRPQARLTGCSHRRPIVVPQSTRIIKMSPRTMTAPRQQRKMLKALVLVLGLAAVAAFGAQAVWAAGEQVEVNPHTGLALSGFDPVAYFADHQPRVGKPAWELSA